MLFDVPLLQRFAHLLNSGSVREDGTSYGWSDAERQTLIGLVAERGASVLEEGGAAGELRGLAAFVRGAL